MNFVSHCPPVARAFKNQAGLHVFLRILLSIYLVGCSEQVRLTSAVQLAEFENAGPLRPEVDIDRLIRARITIGPYRVIPGDLLELLQIPLVTQARTRERTELAGPVERSVPYLCRVHDNGNITVPIIGQIQAAGRTLAEIETAIIDAYYPKYCVNRPSIIARVTEYKTAKVSIVGAVVNPGRYELRTDQMSLVALLMEAGGIINEGATLIRITHPDEAVTANERTPIETRGETVEPPLILPVKGLNIPFTDVVLQDGDSVEVERLALSLFTVVGLVNGPGNFPYPPDAQYNLMQALAFAGGLNLVAEPRYAAIYRLKGDGAIVSVALKLTDGSKLTDAWTTLIKPGDIVDVAHTPRTRTNLFLQNVFRITVGAAWDPLDEDD